MARRPRAGDIASEVPEGTTHCEVSLPTGSAFKPATLSGAGYPYGWLYVIPGSSGEGSKPSFVVLPGAPAVLDATWQLGAHGLAPRDPPAAQLPAGREKNTNGYPATMVTGTSLVNLGDDNISAVFSEVRQLHYVLRDGYLLILAVKASRVRLGYVTCLWPRPHNDLACGDSQSAFDTLAGTKSGGLPGHNEAIIRSRYTLAFRKYSLIRNFKSGNC